MARGNLIISVGGAGKGVLNYIKQTLVDRHGSVQASGTVLLSIDGPPPESDGDYLATGGFSLSSRQADQEFYGLKADPKPEFEALAAGNPAGCHSPYLVRTVTRYEAQKLTRLVQNMSPKAGCGGCRPAAFGSFCLETTSLKTEISRAIETARHLAPWGDVEGRRIQLFNVILVGCQFGGTGSGQLTSTAQLLRSLMRAEDRLILALFLPDAFEYVLRKDTDSRDYADAKGWCGLAELARLRKSLGIQDSIEYTSQTSASYGQLFDVCFLLDGRGTNVNQTQSVPRNSIVPAAADALTSLILDDLHSVTKYIDWANRSLVNKHYSALGSHTWVFPAKRLVAEYALRFTASLYQKMLDAANVEEEARQRARVLLNKTLITQMAIDASQNKGLPTHPTEWRALRPRMTVTVNPPQWPQSDSFDICRLEKEVRHCRHIFGGPNNSEVKQDTDQTVEAYLGKPDDQRELTVHGWLNVNASVVRTVLVDNLLLQFKDLFYRRDNTGVYQVRPLSEQANTITEARLFLAETMRTLGMLRDQFKTDQEKGYIADPDVPGQRVLITTFARRAVDALSPQMGAGRDRGLQEQYIAASQVYLEARVWEELMTAGHRLAEDLLNLLEVSWGWVGDAASGWEAFLRDVCLKTVEGERTRLRTVAQEEDDIACRTNFPSAGGAAERALYEQTTGDMDLIDAALSRMSWELTEIAPTGDPRKDLEGRQLLLRTGMEVPPNTATQLVVGRDLLTNEKRELQVSQHSPEQLRSFAEAHVRPRIDELSLWDALYAVFRYEALPAGATPTDAAMQSFVSAKVQDLHMKSEVLFRNAGRAGDAVTYCFSRFVVEETPSGQLSTAFQRELEQTFGATHGLDQLRQELRVASFAHGLDHADWSYFDEAYRKYGDHEDASRLPTSQIYANEKYAFELETIIGQRIRRAVRRPLPPEISCLMNYPEDLETFVMAWLARLFDRIDDPKLPNSFPFVGITSPRQVDLGRPEHFDMVLREYLARGAGRIGAQEVRDEISRRLTAKMLDLKDQPTQELFYRGLIQEAQGNDPFWLKGATMDAGVPKDIWIEVFLAIVLRRADRYRIALTI